MTRTVTRDTPPPHHLAAVVTWARRAGSVCRKDRFFSSIAASLAISRCCCWATPSAFASPLGISAGWAETAWSAAATQGLGMGTPIRRPGWRRGVRGSPRGALGVVVVHFLRR